MGMTEDDRPAPRRSAPPSTAGGGEENATPECPAADPDGPVAGERPATTGAPAATAAGPSTDPGPLVLEDFLPYRLATLSNRVSRAIAALYSERFGITIPEWRVMAVLGERPEISANAVAERTAMDKVAVSRAVRRLLKKGLLERHFAPDDRRRSVLALSGRGLVVYREVVPLARRFEAALLAALTPEEAAILSLLLSKLEALPIETLPERTHDESD